MQLLSLPDALVVIRAVLVCPCLWALIRHCSCAHGRELLRDFLRVVGCAGSGSSKNPNAKLLERKTRKWRADALKKCMLIASAFGLCTGAWIFTRWSLGRERAPAPSLKHDVVLVSAVALANTFCVLPARITESTLDIWTSLLMLLACVFFTPFDSSENLPGTFHVVFVTARIVCPALSGYKATGFWGNAAFFCSSTIALALVPGERAQSLNLGEHVVIQLSELLIFSLIGAILWHCLMAVEVQRIEAQSSKIDLEAGRVLLDAICDAVFGLDASLRIITHVPKLADLLLHGRQQILQGRLLTDYASSPDDVQRLRQCLCTQIENGTAVADAIHVSLRDTAGSKVNVELFHVKYSNVDGAVQHLVGVRESTGHAPREPLEAASVPASADFDTCQQELAIERPLSITLLANNCRVIAFSPTLAQVQGLRLKKPFDNCLPERYRPHFLRRYGKSWRNFVASGAEEKTVHVGKIGLLTRSGSLGVELEANCQITFYSRPGSSAGSLQLTDSLGDTEESDEAGRTTAVVTLTEGRWLKTRKWSRTSVPPQSSRTETGVGQSVHMGARTLEHAQDRPEPRTTVTL